MARTPAAPGLAPRKPPRPGMRSACGFRRHRARAERAGPAGWPGVALPDFAELVPQGRPGETGRCGVRPRDGRRAPCPRPGVPLRGGRAAADHARWHLRRIGRQDRRVPDRRHDDGGVARSGWLGCALSAATPRSAPAPGLFTPRRRHPHRRLHCRHRPDRRDARRGSGRPRACGRRRPWRAVPHASRARWRGRPISR